jgi:iron complex outermembrane receptor protein
MYHPRTVFAFSAMACAVSAAWAQESAPMLPPTTVTASPLGSNTFEQVEPVNNLEGAELRQKARSTIGDTLNDEPGVSQTSFGPNASRPIIRGLGGFDVRVLSNGVSTIDASASSPDHAVAAEPLTLRKVEVIRGPAAVLYGGNAVGGVVNMFDSRIPMEGMTRPYSGSVDLGYDTANTGRAGVVQTDFGNERFVGHVEAFARKSGLLSIPGNAWTEQQQVLRGAAGPSGKLTNSQGQSDGGSLGGSLIWDNGYTGLAVSQFNSDYGTVAEPDVTIRLRQTKGDLAGEVRDISPFIQTVRYKLTYADYDHKEIELGTVATQFKTSGYNGRADLLHGKVGPFTGAFGLEFGDIKVSASGDEAFLPSTKTTGAAVYVFEEMPVAEQHKFSMGARVGSQKVEAEPFAITGAPAASRSFVPFSGALGFLYKLSSVWATTANLSYTQRAPTFQELYADGPHLATDQFEIGNANLGMAKSTAVDLQLKGQNAFFTGSVGVFYNRFQNFIGLFPTGLFRNPDTRAVVNPALDPDAIAEFQFAGVPARFYGFEANIAVPVARNWTVLAKGDYTNAEQTNTGQPLPYIPPLRVGAGLQYVQGRFTGVVNILGASRQDRVPLFITPTPGYANLTATASYTFVKSKTGQIDGFLQANNLLDQTIRYATSSLKDIAPAGALGVAAGLRGTF